MVQKAAHFQLPRLPLIPIALRSFMYGIMGISLLLVYPWWPWNLLGLLPMARGLVIWRLDFIPQWCYRVKIDEQQLCFQGSEYRWADLTAIKVEQLQGYRTLYLTYAAKGIPKSISIKDSVVHFDKLVRACYDRYLMQPVSNEGEMSTSGHLSNVNIVPLR